MLREIDLWLIVSELLQIKSCRLVRNCHTDFTHADIPDVRIELVASLWKVNNDRRWTAPYYWAGFQLQGQWRQTIRLLQRLRPLEFVAPQAVEKGYFSRVYLEGRTFESESYPLDLNIRSNFSVRKLRAGIYLLFGSLTGLPILNCWVTLRRSLQHLQLGSEQYGDAFAGSSGSGIG